MVTVNMAADNLGGISRIIAIGPAALRRIRTDYPSKKKYLEVLPGEDLIEIPDSFFAHTVSEEKTITDSGHLFKVTCSGAMFRCPENEAISDRLQHGPGWIILSVDSLGGARAFGNKEHLLFFESVSDTGTAQADIAKITFSFSGELPIHSVQIHRFTNNYI